MVASVTQTTPLLVQDLADRQRDRALIAADARGDLVDVGELVGGLDARFRPPFVVLDDQLDLAPEHAAGLVDLVGGQLHGCVAVVAGHGRRAGQADDDADLDRFGVLRRAAIGSGRAVVAAAAAPASSGRASQFRVESSHLLLPL